MAERMDIEGFFEEIDPDLLKYASAFRKCGLIECPVTMKYWRENDFQNLEYSGSSRRISSAYRQFTCAQLKGLCDTFHIFHLLVV